MAVDVNDYGKFRTAEGTLSEVVSQLDADERTTGDVVSFEYDGSDYDSVSVPVALWVGLIFDCGVFQFHVVVQFFHCITRFEV